MCSIDSNYEYISYMELFDRHTRRSYSEALISSSSFLSPPLFSSESTPVTELSPGSAPAVLPLGEERNEIDTSPTYL
jgi:hypothetical protein